LRLKQKKKIMDEMILRKIRKNVLKNYQHREKFITYSLEMHSHSYINVIRMGKRKNNLLHGANLKCTVRELIKEGDYSNQIEKRHCSQSKKYGESLTYTLNGSD
jgi:hypothetical protein